MTDNPPPLEVPARTIPVPAHLSAEAQAVLSMDLFEESIYPDVGDHAGWREMISARDAMILPMFESMASGVAADVEKMEVGGATVYVVVPEEIDDDSQVILSLHGGALILGGGESCRFSGVSQAGTLRSRVWSLDYRMPPDHPYPAGLDDSVAAYRALLDERRPEDIVIAGGSAGANLAAAVVLRARDEGLPLPAALLLMTPELDLTESGDTFHTNLGVDAFLGPLMPVNLLYAAGHDLAHPHLSPLFGDFTKGFPPTFLTSGTRDLFLSNAVRMHRALRAADVRAELHVIEAGPHGGFMGAAPEDRELTLEARRFLESVRGSHRDA